MTFEEFQSLGREERLRVQLADFALVGATQTSAEESQTSDVELTAEMKSILKAALKEDSADRLIFGDKLSVYLRHRLAYQISKEIQIGESTVLKVIETYERNVMKVSG